MRQRLSRGIVGKIATLHGGYATPFLSELATGRDRRKQRTRSSCLDAARPTIQVGRRGSLTVSETTRVSVVVPMLPVAVESPGLAAFVVPPVFVSCAPTETPVRLVVGLVRRNAGCLLI